MAVGIDRHRGARQRLAPVWGLVLGVLLLTACGTAPQTLTVAVTGDGRVSSDLPGIDCGETCEQVYPGGLVITLTATPGTASTFIGWGGACSGLGTCTLSMTENRQVSATFAAVAPETLTVYLLGSGKGGVASDPAGLACDTDCEVDFPRGTVLTLTTTPTGGSVFAGWGGACSGTGTCIVVLSEDREVTATFTPPAVPPGAPLPPPSSPPPGTARPASLAELLRLSDGLPFDGDDARNCMVNGLSLPGQGLHAVGAGLHAVGAGLHAVGAVGGLFLLRPGTWPGTPSVRLFDPTEPAALAESLLLPDDFEYAFDDGVILIVDDFAGVFDVPTVLTEPSDFLTLGGLAAIVGSGALTHGALVMHQVLEMVQGLGYEQVSTVVDAPGFRVFSRPDDERRLVVAAIDAGGFDTDTIAQRVGYALDGLALYNDLLGWSLRAAAVNMSFVIVPCAVIEDFEAAPPSTFEAYVAALGADNAVAADFYGRLVALLAAPAGGSEEPLLGLFEEIVDCGFYGKGIEAVGVTIGVLGNQEPGPVPSWADVVSGAAFEGQPYPWWCFSGGRTVFVGSAGNFGLDYPMYPAAWPLVIGVSASQGSEPDGFTLMKSAFSNSGEVMAPGALFELGRSAGGLSALAYAGTSFAAPVVSLFSVLDLMQGYPACWDWFLASSRLTEAEDVGNLPLPSAVESYCAFVLD